MSLPQTSTAQDLILTDPGSVPPAAPSNPIPEPSAGPILYLDPTATQVAPNPTITAPSASSGASSACSSGQCGTSTMGQGGQGQAAGGQGQGGQGQGGGGQGGQGGQGQGQGGQGEGPPSLRGPSNKTPNPTTDAPLWSRVPEISTLTVPGWFVIPPTGPGYYSLWDVITNNYREKPPKYPYPRFSIMAFSFYDADFRYLENPNNQDHDFFDPIKRIHLGDDWLFSTGGEFRARYNNEVNSRLTGRNNVYELTRTRIYGDLWYQDLFRIYAEFIGANIYNSNLPPTPFDRDHGDFLNLFTDLHLFDYDKHPVYFRGGRQELYFGSQRLISNLDWVNTRRTFEGTRAFWRGDKWDLDAFCVAPVIPNAQKFNSIDDKQVFSGLWSTFYPRAGQDMDFYVLNLDHSLGAFPGLGSTPGPAYNVTTLGSRYVGKANDWLWDCEGMLQFGSWGKQGDLAKAYTTGGGYHFSKLPLTPQLWFYYDFASGDPHPGTGVHQTFNQLFPFGHPYFGMTDLVGRQNINDFNTQLTFFPTKWITSAVQYHVLRLDSPFDSLYNSAGVPIRTDPTGKAGTSVGEVLTLVTNFHLDKHQDVFINYAHMYTGNFIKATGPGGGAFDAFWVQYSFRW